MGKPSPIGSVPPCIRQMPVLPRSVLREPYEEKTAMVSVKRPVLIPRPVLREPGIRRTPPPPATVHDNHIVGNRVRAYKSV